VEKYSEARDFKVEGRFWHVNLARGGRSFKGKKRPKQIRGFGYFIKRSFKLS
jgi:hypothetical protein